MKQNRQFHWLFLFSFLPAFLLAQDGFPTLVGKYKMNSTAGGSNMLEIGKDSVMEIYSLAGGSTLRLKILEVSNGKMTVAPIAENLNTHHDMDVQVGIGIQKTDVGPKISQWRYGLEGGVLSIIDEKTGKKEVAINCATGICDLQKDYLRLSKIEVDLPYDSTHRYEAFPIPEETRCFYYGSFNPSFAAIYGSGNAVCVNGDFVNPVFLPTEIQAMPAHNPTSELIVVGFIDRKTGINDLKTLLGHLTNGGIHEVYIAVRENAVVSQPLQVRLAKLEINSLKNANYTENVEDWINRGK